jgi:ATP-dependent RNA helicase MSS116
MDGHCFPPQIHTECKALLTFHDLKSTCCVGGTNMKSEARTLAGRIDILVATPGRLIDHLKNTQGVAQRLRGILVLTMDEADRMLEMGFRLGGAFFFFWF